MAHTDKRSNLTFDFCQSTRVHGHFIFCKFHLRWLFPWPVPIPIPFILSWHISAFSKHDVQMEQPDSCQPRLNTSVTLNIWQPTFQALIEKMSSEPENHRCPHKMRSVSDSAAVALTTFQYISSKGEEKRGKRETLMKDNIKLLTCVWTFSETYVCIQTWHMVMTRAGGTALVLCSRSALGKLLIFERRGYSCMPKVPRFKKKNDKLLWKVVKYFRNRFALVHLNVIIYLDISADTTKCVGAKGWWNRIFCILQIEMAQLSGWT